MEFVNTAYVPTTSMTLVSFTKLIKEGYDRDMHTKTLVHVATGKKVCDIEEHFGVMTLEYNPIPIQLTEYVEYEAIVDLRNKMENKTSNNPTNGSTAIVELTAPEIIEVLNNQAPKEKEVEKTPQLTTNSESISVPITHGKSGMEPHIMELNQSGEGQRNPSFNNPHSSRQVDSGGGGDHLTKALNDGPKGRFTKAPNMKNGGLKKHKKPRITNQKEVEYSHRKTHQKDPNRTAKAWWRPPANGFQITPTNEVQKRPSNQGFSDSQYGFSKHAHQDMQHTAKLDQKRGLFPEKKVYFKGFTNFISTV